jgi:hypothetical protein
MMFLNNSSFGMEPPFWDTEGQIALLNQRARMPNLSQKVLAEMLAQAYQLERGSYNERISGQIRDIIQYLKTRIDEVGYYYGEPQQSCDYQADSVLQKLYADKVRLECDTSIRLN